MGKRLTRPESFIQTSDPSFDFRYLKLTSGKGFYDLAKSAKKYKNVFKDLESFLYESVQNNKNIEEIIKNYTSPKGGKLYAKDNEYTSNLINSLRKNCKQCDKQILHYFDGIKNGKESLTHIHLKRGGKGQTVLFGFSYDKTFYVVAIDPEHEF